MKKVMMGVIFLLTMNAYNMSMAMMQRRASAAADSAVNEARRRVATTRVPAAPRGSTRVPAGHRRFTSQAGDYEPMTRVEEKELERYRPSNDRPLEEPDLFFGRYKESSRTYQSPIQDEHYKPGFTDPKLRDDFNRQYLKNLKNFQEWQHRGWNDIRSFDGYAAAFNDVDKTIEKFIAKFDAGAQISPGLIHNLMKERKNIRERYSRDVYDESLVNVVDLSSKRSELDKLYYVFTHALPYSAKKKEAAKTFNDILEKYKFRVAVFNKVLNDPNLDNRTRSWAKEMAHKHNDFAIDMSKYGSIINYAQPQQGHSLWDWLTGKGTGHGSKGSGNINDLD